MGKRSLYCPLLINSLSVTALANHNPNPDVKRIYKEGTAKRTFTAQCLPHTVLGT